MPGQDHDGRQLSRGEFSIPRRNGGYATGTKTSRLARKRVYGSGPALKAAAARKPAPVRVRAPGLTAGAWERLIPYDSHWGMMTWLLRASMRTSQPAASRGGYQAAGIAEPGQVTRLDQRGY